MHSNIENYLSKTDWRVKENSNQHFSLQGLNTHITAKAISNYWLDYVYPSGIASAHRTGQIHIHDLGTLGPYCVGWDLTDLLIKGFGGVPSKLASKPAKHLRTALMHVVNFMYTLQGEAAGAIAFSHIDTLMSPFIREDGLDHQEVRQIMQEFIFNMNVPTRVGGQTPFTNLSFDLMAPSQFSNTSAIVGGKPMKYTYSDLQPEMDMFNRAFAEIMIDGDADGRPFTFPIPTYNITKDFDWDNPDLIPLWEMTAKFGIPTFANFIGSDLDPDDVTSLCCRLRLDNRDVARRTGGLFASAPLTGSAGVCTINLPRIGYDANGDIDAFYAELDNMMDIAKRSLIIKRGVIEGLTDDGLYPYSSFYLRKVKEQSGEYWSNHFLTIGILGMSDAILNMFGTSIASDKGREFSEDVLNHMLERIESYKEETGELWNLEATPAESSTHRLAMIDQTACPGIRMHCSEDNKSDSPYYTNSTNLPVGYTDDIFLAMKHQEGLLQLYTGGSVAHMYLGEPIETWEGARSLVRSIATNFKIPYFTVTPTFSICPKDKYISGEYPVCPKCGATTDVFTRVVGYLRSTSSFNDGKQAEFEDRKEYIAR